MLLDVKVKVFLFKISHIFPLSFVLVNQIRNISNPIGLQDHAYWINMNTTDNSIRSIVYPSASNSGHLTVQLICDQTLAFSRLEVIGEKSLNEYTMQLTSACACWNGCGQPSPDPGPFNWEFWVITGSVSVAVFLLFCMMISCLFCSKPKRRDWNMPVNEKTPFMKGSINHWT
jgi:hypothetical protein